MNDWGKLLVSALQNDIETVPKGWETSAEISAKWKCGTSTASQRLRLLERQNLVERKKFRVMTGRGVFPVPHYRPAKR